jgi:hypothetical protein
LADEAISSSEHPHERRREDRAHRDKHRRQTKQNRQDHISDLRYSAYMLAARRLKQLDQIAGRIDQQDLRAAGPGHDIVAELHADGAQPRHLAGKIVHDQVNAIPAARGRSKPRTFCRRGV